MKILWLKSELLHPVDKGGKIRTYQMLRHLKLEHEVTYLSLVSPSDPPEAFELASEYSHKLVTVPLREPRRFSPAFYRDVALNVVSPLPFAIQKYRSAEMRRAIEGELGRERYDVVVCDFLVPSVNLPDRLGVATVLFQHNVESLIWERHFETQRDVVKRAFFRDQWRKMERYERAACRRFDAVAAVSVDDRDLMRSRFGIEHVFDVPTGVDAEFFAPLGGELAAAELVFTGSMDWMPNEDAVLYFAEHVLPLVAKAIPDVSLTVVGRRPTRPVLTLAEVDARVHVTGGVDDIRPYVDRAAAYVVPIRVGGGTRLKIFEAMAMEKAVISTTVGAEGLPVRDGEELLLRDEPEAFARAVVEVLSDRELASDLGRRARAVVLERFGWSRAASVFADVCERAVANRQASAPADERASSAPSETSESAKSAV